MSKDWYPNCPKCRQKAHASPGIHVDTWKEADGEGGSGWARRKWVEFVCSNCRFEFAVEAENGLF